MAERWPAMPGDATPKSARRQEGGAPAFETAIPRGPRRILEALFRYGECQSGDAWGLHCITGHVPVGRNDRSPIRWAAL